MSPLVTLALVRTLALAATQPYVIALDGRDVGFAQLSVDRSTKGRIAYIFKAELAVSGDPCLRSHEESSGQAHLDDPVLPEELFVALGPDLGQGCHRVSGAGKTGEGCWESASPEAAAGRLFGIPVQVQYDANLMPISVRYPTLGLAYRSIAEVPAELARCERTLADDGVVAPGGAGVSARKLTAAAYLGPDATTHVHKAGVLLPPGVADALLDVRAQEIDSCRVAAEALDKALAARGYASRQVMGLLLDEGRYFPHAWNEVRVGKSWLAVDATTGTGWADAGRIRVGLVSEFQSGLGLLRLLHAPPKLVLTAHR